MTATDDFFAERKDQSEVKSRIVQKFFASWANVIINTAKRQGLRPKLGYVDLFSGPGRYLDGASSTPLLVMGYALSSPDLAANLVSTFNDRDPEHTASLQVALAALPGYERLKHQPQIICDEVDSDIEAIFARTKMVPTLSFIDPYGYKGLTVGLIRAIAKDWGSDCIFFFNYRRINAAINNDAFRAHMEALFGAERLQRMREAVGSLKPAARVDYVLKMVGAALRDHGFGYVLPFRFKDENGKRTTHALIYATKQPKGYEIMKNIMAQESSSHDHGVPSFSYSPDEIRQNANLNLDLTDPIEGLANEIAERFAGRVMTMREVFEEHHLDRLFIERNYKDAILLLEEKNQVITDPAKRRKGTCAPHVLVTFPSRRAT